MNFIQFYNVLMNNIILDHCVVLFFSKRAVSEMFPVWSTNYWTSGFHFMHRCLHSFNNFRRLYFSLVIYSVRNRMYGFPFVFRCIELIYREIKSLLYATRLFIAEFPFSFKFWRRKIPSGENPFDQKLWLIDHVNTVRLEMTEFNRKTWIRTFPIKFCRFAWL